MIPLGWPCQRGASGRAPKAGFGLFPVRAPAAGYRVRVGNVRWAISRAAGAAETPDHRQSARGVRGQDLVARIESMADCETGKLQ